MQNFTVEKLSLGVFRSGVHSILWPGIDRILYIEDLSELYHVTAMM